MVLCYCTISAAAQNLYGELIQDGTKHILQELYSCHAAVCPTEQELHDRQGKDRQQAEAGVDGWVGIH